MSMIEKFLENKKALHENLDNVLEEMKAAARVKGDKLIDEFIDGVEAMIAEASDEEFVEFITSGKLDDEDINAAIMFRTKARKVETCNEPCEEPNEKHGHHVHVFVVH